MILTGAKVPHNFIHLILNPEGQGRFICRNISSSMYALHCFPDVCLCRDVSQIGLSLQILQCSKRREQNFQFWKLLAVVLDTNIKSVNKVHKRSDETLVMLPLI